jgi:hypothetical protein
MGLAYCSAKGVSLLFFPFERRVIGSNRNKRIYSLRGILGIIKKRENKLEAIMV